MNESLSRTIAALFEKLKGNEEVSSDISLLRDEIRNVIDSDETISGKFRRLEESFREIIPVEKQRYSAAVKALSTTSKLTRQEIVAAVNNQLDELKIVEKGLMPALPGWRVELKVLEAKSQEIRGEITRLRDQIVLLENEEKAVISGIASREKEMGLVEKEIGKIFMDIGAEITYIRNKVEEFTVENAVVPPKPQSVPVAVNIPAPPMDLPAKIDSSAIVDISSPAASPVTTALPAGTMGSDEHKIEMSAQVTIQDPQFQKKCPMCGGRMDYYIHEDMWQCYSCAYEERMKAEAPDKSGVKKEQVDAQNPAPDPVPAHNPFPLRAAHSESLSSGENHAWQKEPSAITSQPSGKKKACPVCRKKMHWHEKEQAWQCTHCGYERSI